MSQNLLHYYILVLQCLFKIFTFIYKKDIHLEASKYMKEYLEFVTICEGENVDRYYFRNWTEKQIIDKLVLFLVEKQFYLDGPMVVIIIIKSFTLYARPKVMEEDFRQCITTYNCHILLHFIVGRVSLTDILCFGMRRYFVLE